MLDVQWHMLLLNEHILRSHEHMLHRIKHVMLTETDTVSLLKHMTYTGQWGAHNIVIYGDIWYNIWSTDKQRCVRNFVSYELVMSSYEPCKNLKQFIISAGEGNRSVDSDK